LTHTIMYSNYIKGKLRFYNWRNHTSIPCTLVCFLCYTYTNIVPPNTIHEVDIMLVLIGTLISNITNVHIHIKHVMSIVESTLTVSDQWPYW